MVKKQIKRIKKLLTPFVFFLIFIGLWELIGRIFDTPAYLLPLPSKIFLDFFSHFYILLNHAGITMLEAILGFIIANILGVFVAIAFAHSNTIEKGFYPYAIALKTTPIIALAPLLVLWFGSGIWSKVAAAVLICFFPAIVNTTKGLKSIDIEALNLFKSLSASKWQILTKLRLPNALPYIFSALKISTSLAVVGAVVGEFVGANKGLGFLILVSSYHLETTEMFSSIIALALSGIIFFGVVNLIEKRIIFWQKPTDTE